MALVGESPGGRRAAILRRAGLPVLATALALTGIARAQDVQPDSVGHLVEGLPVARIEIVVRNIYDPLPESRLRGVYRLANALHIKTRESTLREYLLFRPGQPYLERDARETERILRGLSILRPQSLSARREGDSVVVRVETRDAWSTSPEFNIESGGGDVFGAVGLVEKNLLGFGKRVAFSYREDPSGISRSIGYSDPNVVGSRIHLEIGGGNGSEGARNQFRVGVPFYSESVPLTYGFSFNRSTSVARLYEDNAEVANFDRRVEQTESWFGRGRRLGTRVVRVVGSFTTLDRRFGPSRVEPGAPEEFEGGEENLDVRRLAVEVSLWRPRFFSKRGIEGLGDVEDFDLGQSVSITTGFSPKFFGSTFDEGFVRARIEAGGQLRGALFGKILADAETRIRDEPLETILRTEGRAYLQQGPYQTSVIAAYGVAGIQVVRDFQVILGGLNGLRAYPVNALAGQQAWRFNAEHRWLLARDWMQFFSFGTAAFYDLARTWGPGSASELWHQDAGIGLRLSLPRSGLDDVARIDIAWPLSPSIDGRRDPVFSFGSKQAF